MLVLDTEQWAQQQFGACDLGDVRRTRRLVKFAAQVAGDPDASTPGQTEHWSDLKAAYRLLDRKQVTFDAVATPHWQQTRQRPSGTWLISCDTTEVDFGASNAATGLGPLGQGFGRGFLLHSGLMIQPDTEEVVGLAGQKIRYRRPVPKNEPLRRRLARDRESRVWGELIDQIGPPPEGVRWVDLCDRGADNFEVFCKLLLNRHDWVVRAARLNRVLLHENQELTLADYLDTLPLAGTYQLSYRSKTHGRRTAQIEVRFAPLLMPAPRQQSPWLRELGITRIGMNVVEVREVKAPKGVKPLHWVLYTSLPVTTFEEAWTVIEYYEKRPLVEEFHKALKTGCRVEERQYETSDRLEAITAVLSVTAIRLLQLRSAARETPDRAATDVVPRHWVTVLRCLRRGRRIETVREFFRELAGLGGHLLRKGDGEPGWITLWRGFEKLHIALRAIHGYRKKCG
jgi:Transposase DNA-binding